MKNFKKIAALVLSVLLCASMLAACGEQAEEAPAELTYKVSVVDAVGNPHTEGVIVRFLSGSEQVAMEVIGADGTVSRTMAAGEYTVELMFTGDESAYHYDKEGLTLSAEKTELEIVLSYAPKAEPQTLHVGSESYQAYPVAVGSTFVELTAGQRNYFLFTPTTAGTYQFSVSGEVEKFGYYGAPHFVQSESSVEVADNTFTISVSASMIGTDGGTSVYVLGVDGGSAEDCVLTIERIGDAQRTLEDEPWTIYETTAQLAAYTLPAGANLMEFDITASTDTYDLVYNEADGFYHLDSAEGPLVLVRLGVNGKYLDCFKTILERSGISKYFFDEDGNFIKKESYNECLFEYFEYMDEDKGVYPLTEDLKYIIQQRGDHAGWFDASSSGYIFVDENGNRVDGVNPEISWLFMCYYIG